MGEGEVVEGMERQRETANRKRGGELIWDSRNSKPRQ